MTDEPYVLLLSSLFQTTAEEDLHRLAASLTKRLSRRGTVIYHIDDPPGSLFFILRGTVKMQLPSRRGSPFTIGWTPAGDHFGTMSLSGDIPRSETAVALEDCDLLLLNRGVARAFFQDHPEAEQHYVGALARRWRWTLARLGDFMTLDVVGRVSRIILEFLPRFGTADATGGIYIRLLTQMELASLVGATRESVAHALRTLTLEGSIEVRNRRIYVLQPELLEAHLQ